MRSELNSFRYDIGNFNSGSRSGQMSDNLPVFNLLECDSRFTGFDARGRLRLAGQSWATLALGAVNARLTTTGESLPRIPPFRGTLGIDIPYCRLFVGPRLMFSSRQDDGYCGETATDGYAVLGVRVSYVWHRDRGSHIVSFIANNVTNELDRNHMSCIRIECLRWDAGSG